MDFFDLRKETVMPSFASGSAEQILYLLKRSLTVVLGLFSLTGEVIGQESAEMNFPEIWLYEIS